MSHSIVDVLSEVTFTFIQEFLTASSLPAVAVLGMGFYVPFDGSLICGGHLDFQTKIGTFFTNSCLINSLAFVILS